MGSRKSHAGCFITIFIIIMIFHKLKTILPSSYPPLCIGDNVSERIFHGKCLDVSLDPSLRFHLQVQTVSKKFSRFKSIFHKNRGILNNKCLKMTYYWLVYPYLIYCTSFWGGAFDSVFEPISIIQKGVIRAMCGVSRGTITLNLFIEMHFLSFQQIVSYVTCIYVFHSHSNPHFTQYFSYRSYEKSTRTSEQRLLSLPACSLVCCRQTLSYRGDNAYNRKPFAIRNTDNCNSFKFKLKRQMLSELL